ncbi:50S ribosomal protein L29 [Candidatus Gugararchaeum adminiculabundum]|nr:50S ribosomal protein L29 [Candidatus Gugararchaeum adminiculabundum]
MAIIRSEEARELNPNEIQHRLVELEKEYNSELGKIAGGGRPENPGRVREIKKTIARLLTIIKEAGTKKRKSTGKRAERIARGKKQAAAKAEAKIKEAKEKKAAAKKESEDAAAKSEKSDDNKSKKLEGDD